jgi:uncharacterized protein
MVCFMVVLFFSVTGLTLNHPTWSLGSAGSEITETGSLPAEWRSGETVDWLVVSEYLRAEHSLRGSVAEHEATADEATITYKGPGFAADAFIDATDGSYEITIASQGIVGVMNDLHKGRDSTSSWKWLIDVSAIVLILISFSGLVLQLFLRRRRRSAMWTVFGGTIVLAFFYYLAMR